MRVVLVGLGQVGLKYDIGNRFSYLTHAKVLATMREFNLIAGVDPDEEARALFEATYDAQSFPSLDALASSTAFEHVDLFVVATPTTTHYKVCLDILSKKDSIIILLEKPGCETNYQREILGELAQNKNSRIYVNTMRRCLDLFEVMRLEHLSGQAPLLSCYVIYPQDFWNNGIHAFDLLAYITETRFRPEGNVVDLNECFWGHMGSTRILFSQSSSSSSSIFLMQFEFEYCYKVFDLFTGRAESHTARPLWFNQNYNVIDLDNKKKENAPRVDLQLRWYKKFLSTVNKEGSWLTTLYDIIGYENSLNS